VEQAGGRHTLRINPALPGNREGKVKKPATESTVAQGTVECEELSSADQNVNSQLFSELSEP